MTCEEKGLAKKKFTKVASREECEVLCDEFIGDNGEECNTIFLSYKSGRNPYYICYLYQACNYLTTTKRKIPGTTFTKRKLFVKITNKCKQKLKLDTANVGENSLLKRVPT